MTSTRFLPVAITAVDESSGCVGALTDDGRWVRPEPVPLSAVTRDGAYRYDRWTVARLGPSTSADARVEDRAILDGPTLERALSDDERWSLLSAHLDPGVEAALAEKRSLGLVRARIRRARTMRATRGREFVRVDFDDEAGGSYDWIVPELRFVRWFHEHPNAAAERFAHLPTILAIGLTKPNGRFPGRFGGCHPLVVGVHTSPGYDAG